MATVKEVLLKHQERGDKTWNVKVRVTHNRQTGYIPTSHYLTSKQIKSKDFTIKDEFIMRMVNPVVDDYRKKISALGIKIHAMTVKDIIKEITRIEEPNDINFSTFCIEYIAGLRASKKYSSADIMQTVFNSITDFFQTDRIMTSQITALALRDYEAFLKKRRVMYRENQYGKIIKIVRPPMGSGIFNYMRDLRVMFNAARDKYNDEDLGIYRIPHYPFRKYKVKQPPAPQKRNLTIGHVRMIRDCEVEPGGRMELARDMFMLSFYLCGMNSVDIYQLRRKDIKGRVEYFRSKTKGRRKDRAFISIDAIDQALPLLVKYIGTVQNRYTDSDNFNTAINKGLKQVRDQINIQVDRDDQLPNLTFYYARHTFADLARNKCRFSKDDVALALNHVDQGRKTTDTYIAPDWKIVDELQQAVVGLL